MMDREVKAFDAGMIHEAQRINLKNSVAATKSERSEFNCMTS